MFNPQKTKSDVKPQIRNFRHEKHLFTNLKYRILIIDFTIIHRLILLAAHDF